VSSQSVKGSSGKHGSSKNGIVVPSWEPEAPKVEILTKNEVEEDEEEDYEEEDEEEEEVDELSEEEREEDSLEEESHKVSSLLHIYNQHLKTQRSPEVSSG
jgi:TATA-binding protein-associated factor Taf7